MNDSEFETLAAATLEAIERALEACAADVEAERSGNVLTLELGDGARVVINGQTPTRQIWVAARSGGFHFARDGDLWRDTRDGSELFAALARIVGVPALASAPPQAP
jgi:CyaY protein